MDRRSLLFITLITLSFLGIRYYYDQKAEEALALHPQPVQTVVSTKPETPASSSVQEFQKQKTSDKPKTHTLYVLESPYQQLVISPVGGSIVEINLPFQTKKDGVSQVQPMYIDTELAQLKSPDAYFPLSPALRYDGSKATPTIGGFYPLLRRTADVGTLPIASMLLFSQDREFDTSTYKVVHFDKQSITLESQLPSKNIRKTFSFPKDPSKFPYCIDVEIDVIGNKKDLYISSGAPDIELFSGTPGSTLKYLLIRGTKNEVVQVDLPKTDFQSTSLQPDWSATSNGFFALILDPSRGMKPGLSFTRIPDDKAPSRLHELPTYKSLELPGFRAEIPLSSDAESFKARLYAGPLSDKIFSTIDTNSVKDGKQKPSNFSASISYHGWFSFISEPFAKFLYFIMSSCYSVVHSWAFAIIFATIILRVLMYPLTKWSQKSMLRMREIAPLVKAIQNKYKKDPKRAQIEIMSLYREKGVNPFSGCLPLLIQMPFLIGMFDLLKSTYELRGSVFIPGWIDDLSQPDRLFSFGISLPFLGSYFHLLPVLLAVVMWWQQKLSTPLPQNPANMTDAERQQKAMGNVMTVVMTVLFYHFPAGLNLYWLSSMLLSIIQQIWTNKQFAQSKKA